MENGKWIMDNEVKAKKGEKKSKNIIFRMRIFHYPLSIKNYERLADHRAARSVRQTL
jgi:hypothetical protein